MRSVMALLLLAGALSACDRQSQSPSQANATQGTVTTADEVPSDGTAEDASSFRYQLDRAKAGTPAPDISFAAPDGTKKTLRDFAGKPVLLNLWATWCTPCVAEMPTLDALVDTHRAQGLHVVTVSQDNRAELVKPFFDKRNFRNLQPWTDPENNLGFHYATGMLPTSILYDAKGKEIVRVIGAMDWNGEEARKLIAEAF